MNLDRIFDYTEKEWDYFKAKARKAKAPDGSEHWNGPVVFGPSWFEVTELIDHMEKANRCWKVWNKLSLKTPQKWLNQISKTETLDELERIS